MVRRCLPARQCRETRFLSKTWFLVLCLLLTACASSAPAFTSPVESERLPTRAPSPTPTATPIPARAYYEEGLRYQRLGEMEAARSSFTAAIERDRDFAPAYVGRGRVHLVQDRPRRALDDAEAALKISPSGAAHALRGDALYRMSRYRSALKALQRAAELEPDLQAETFHTRWMAARAIPRPARLLVLSREYADRHPDDPWRHYYRGWALTELGAPGFAVKILVEGMEETSVPPALLWFALGHAYAGDGSWREAVTALEVARGMMEAGDNSLSVHSDQPVADLFAALGRIYIGAGRCVDAEVMLEHAISIGAPTSEYATALEEARICQTPTPVPTPTPFVTVTPEPE